jgi:copper(I)-binding protein
MSFRMLLSLTTALAFAPVFAHAEDDDHLSQLGELRAVHAWTRATSGSEAFVFVELENEGESAVTLDGARTEIAETVDLVGFQLKDGETIYEPIPSVPIAPGRDLHLEPDGLALRLGGLSMALVEGEEFDLDLQTSLGVLAVHVEIEAKDAKTHNHAGHAH